MPITRLPLMFSGAPTTKKPAPQASLPTPTTGQHPRIQTGLTQDLFFKGNSKKTEATPAAQPPQVSNLVHRLAELGAPDKPTANRVAFYVSKHFSPDGKEHQYTYGDLLQDSQRMAAGYLQKGLGGKRIAVAETNTLDLLSTYYGGLAAGATMVPLNLLALQDEGTKARVLGHMISGPKCDGYVFGQDPLFNSMQGFKKILTMKNTPVVKGIVQNYMDQKPANSPMAKLLYKKLNTEMDHKLSVAVAGLQQKGINPTDQDKAELAAKILSDFKTLYEAIPKELTLITPDAKSKMMRLKPLKLSDLETNPSPDKLAEIIFTSGTSGNPKGVGKTHANMAFTAESVSRELDKFIQPQDTILLGLPLFHIFGKAVMLTGVNRQAPMVMLPSLSAALKDKESLDNVMKTIRDYNVTVLPSVPIFLEKLVDHAQKNPEAKESLKNLRVVLSGGSALKKSTYDALKAINPDIKILEGYGSSEGGINTLNSSGHSGFVGTPLDKVEVKLMKATSQSGGDLKENKEAGEIWVRSPGVSTSYVEGTVPKGASTRIADEEGFYRTGDQGRNVLVRASSKPLSTIPGQDDEIYMNQLQIMGRESNFIKDTGGERRAPEEFESAVKQADSRIADAMAVAFKPNRETEKSVVVAVTSDPSVTEESLKKAMSIQVATGKIPGALVPKYIVVLNRSSLPDAFKNEFKREAGYKATKSFVEQVISKNLIQLQDKSALSREKTVVQNNDQLQQFANEYRYSG